MKQNRKENSEKECGVADKNTSLLFQSFVQDFISLSSFIYNFSHSL